MGYMDNMKEDMKQYGGGSSSGDYFEFDQPGVYRMRLLVQPKTIAYHFPPQGRPDVCVGIDEGCTHHKADEKKATLRLVTYIIDRADGKVKRAELPLSVNYSINALQEDMDFAFDGFPMPYDVKVNYDPKNPDPKSKYTVTPSPKQEPLTDEEEGMLADAMKKQTPEQFVEMKKKYQSREVNRSDVQVSQRNVQVENLPAEYPDVQINPEDIPF